MLLVAVFEIAVLAPIYKHVVGVKTHRVPSHTMRPTLKLGDKFITRLGMCKGRIPDRGDIVTFPYPEDRSVTFVKRVIGFPGEKIQIKDKIVFVNDSSLYDPWRVHEDKKVLSRETSPRDNFGP